jgi:hypothetical protein
MTIDVSTQWFLTDESGPEPWRDGSEVVVVRSEEHLVSLLRIYAEKKPRVFTLKGPISGIAYIGIGGPFAAIHYYPKVPSSTRSLSATPAVRHTDEKQWFTLVGEPSSFAADHVMPVGELIHVVAHLYRTGELADWIQWK